MAEPFLEGDIFAGKYRIEEVLGQGGMGMVLAARHLKLDEPVAIKVLLPAMIELPGMVERFIREARASAKIKNDHIVRVTDVDTLPSGVPYMVMERLEGVDLSAHCKRVGALPIADAVRYLLEACSAMGEAHAMGIIHRDLKPGNLFLARQRDESVKLKVLDFGISKIMQATGEITVTEAGTVLGSPSYMSPEQIAAARDLDGRTDIWSLGVILYQLVTGKRPFPAQTVTQLCALILQTTPPRPSELRPDLPLGLEAVILRCLEKDREHRFRTTGDLAAALSPFDADAGAISSIEPSSRQRARPALPSASESSAIAASITLQPAPPRRTQAPLIAGIAGALLMIALGGAGAFALLARSRPSAPAPAAAPTAVVEASAAPPLAAAAPASADAPASAAAAPAPSASASARRSAARPGGTAKHVTYDVGF